MKPAQAREKAWAKPVHCHGCGIVVLTTTGECPRPGCKFRNETGQYVDAEGCCACGTEPEQWTSSASSEHNRLLNEGRL